MGAADMARGVGSGLGVVRTVRVIAVLLYIEMSVYESLLPSIFSRTPLLDGKQSIFDT